MEVDGTRRRRKIRRPQRSDVLRSKSKVPAGYVEATKKLILYLNFIKRSCFRKRFQVLKGLSVCLLMAWVLRPKFGIIPYFPVF